MNKLPKVTRATGSVTVTATPFRVAPPGQVGPLTGADLELMVKLVGQAVNLTYDQATAAFKNTPSAENWKALVLAMHGHQFWHGADEQKRAVAAQRLHNEGVGRWAAVLKDIQTEAFEG